ncbi:copper chaperone CopZ [Gottschalkia purinilytica]|uniref:Copper chaperone CopZ n=1 Tax=Gottschalkia purinilytica TaxID=1503 RepID=A0A0L0WE95_GOTPU|nr:heavy metal-associated domain-containing protein [Gottschalkia purinilytica]KNF09798.1 copper chaperone CopZ [Gottschalkia purinilytica]
MKKTISIEGMSCNHCVGSVKDALSKISGVKEVEVSLEYKKAVVEVEGVDDKTLSDAITSIGFDVVEIE